MVIVTSPAPPDTETLQAVEAHDRAGDPEAALALLEQAIATAPDIARYHRRAWTLLRQLRRYDEALTAARRAAALAPGDATAFADLAAAHGCLREVAAMRAAAEQAIALDPALPAAHFARAAALLVDGDFAEGWQEYEWRLRLPGTAGGIPPDDWPRWDGTPIPNGRLLLFADQGRGDIIQFARYIPWAAARCRELALCCPGEMWPILRQFPELHHLVAEWHHAPPCDCFAPLGSLPMLAETRLDSIPAPIPYLRADPARAATWRERLDAMLPRGYRRVGLIWSGNSAHTGDLERSASLAQFAPLASRPNIALVALQQGPALSQAARYFGRAPLLNLGPELHGFGDTMAVLDALDLLVTVDTGVAHLAGAMGRPVWMLLPFAPDWRWLLDRDDSPWYPTLRLFRQPRPGAWEPAVTQIVTALRRRA
jgi:hypothetical protein